MYERGPWGVDGLFDNGGWGRDNKTKDMTKEVVRWLSEARIPCGLNMRYMEKSQSMVLMRRKEHKGRVVYMTH